MFDTIAAVIDAKARPLTGDDDRPGGQRQAEALADVCGYVLDHGGGEVLPECGGHRVHVNVLIRRDDLENRARAACLDFGGPVSPEALRMLCTFTSSRRGPRLPARPGPGRTCCAPTRSR